jgi:type I restriction enzyme S subunit
MFVPPLEEQSLMIEIIDRIDNKINVETALLAKLKKQKSGLMHDLLTGKVAVKLDQQDPAHV